VNDSSSSEPIALISGVVCVDENQRRISELQGGQPPPASPESGSRRHNRGLVSSHDEVEELKRFGKVTSLYCTEPLKFASTFSTTRSISHSHSFHNEDPSLINSSPPAFSPPLACSTAANTGIASALNMMHFVCITLADHNSYSSKGADKIDEFLGQVIG
jgi:hypothetical protein